MIQEEVRNMEEEGQRLRAVELASQGAWTKWDLPKRKVTWEDLWRLEPFRISFLLRSVYDTLPTPANLHKWGIREDPLCKLCEERGTMAHILSRCITALTQGRYRWCHDKVLMTLDNTLEQERKKKRQPLWKITSIQFVRDSEEPPTTETRRTSLLQMAQSWEMKVDLGGRLQFPQIAQTTLRPDVVLWGKGWQAWLFLVEVGCRGFPAQSVWRMLTAIGMMGKERKAAARRMGEAADRASGLLWSRREELSWKPGGGYGQCLGHHCRPTTGRV
ncbi:hypothetical protein AOLI_G00038480 [Acnodon oligacanthus]